MKNEEDLKSVRTLIAMTEATYNDIAKEASERGIKANAVMNERLEYQNCDKTPSNLVEFQNFANFAVHMIAKYSEMEARILERKANELWSF